MGSASSEMAHFGENAVIFEILRKCQVSFKLNRAVWIHLNVLKWLGIIKMRLVGLRMTYSPLEDDLQTTEDDLQSKEHDLDITEDGQNLLFPFN